MGLFSKKIEIKSPIKGKLVDVTEVKDEAFSTKHLVTEWLLYQQKVKYIHLLTEK